ncbi:MAG: hypothetical protein LBG97_10050, partial [Coriobacteriales bacterium]|nr:hypothetical protein [Coriobacteriales bacterium]
SFGEGRKVPIIELREADDPLLAELADFVYQNVFLFYTQKQWGVTPEEVDPSVTARVPVLVGRDNRYFTDSYQGMPKEGYTALFNNMLAHDNISVFTNLDARNVIAFAKNDLATGVTPVVDLSNSATASSSSTLTSTTVEPYDTIVINNSHFNGKLIYTGPLDFLANKCFGLLPYRSLDFVYIPKNEKHVFPCGTVNYTVSEDYTRITEYTWLTGQDIDHTTIMEEYPREFADLPNQVPYYAILNPKNETHYQQYLSLFKNLPNFHALGRLAEYRYFNMDQIICRALELADTICAGQAS